jgi:hypothetical protein
MNTLRGKNAELLIIKARGTYSYHWALKGSVYQLQSLHNVEKDAMMGEYSNEKMEKQTVVNFSRYY